MSLPRLKPALPSGFQRIFPDRCCILDAVQEETRSAHCSGPSTHEDPHLAKPNFEFQKRQKELEKKRKKEEKKQKKLDRAAAESSSPAESAVAHPESK